MSLDPSTHALATLLFVNRLVKITSGAIIPYSKELAYKAIAIIKIDIIYFLVNVFIYSEELGDLYFLCSF